MCGFGAVMLLIALVACIASHMGAHEHGKSRSEAGKTVGWIGWAVSTVCLCVAGVLFTLVIVRDNPTLTISWVPYEVMKEELITRKFGSTPEFDEGSILQMERHAWIEIRRNEKLVWTLPERPARLGTKLYFPLGFRGNPERGQANQWLNEFLDEHFPIKYGHQAYDPEPVVENGRIVGIYVSVPRIRLTQDSTPAVDRATTSGTEANDSLVLVEAGAAGPANDQDNDDPVVIQATTGDHRPRVYRDSAIYTPPGIDVATPAGEKPPINLEPDYRD